MVPISSLWLPILLSAVFVFIVSSVIHMALPYHRNDFRKVPSEDDVMEALRRFNIPPGDYMVPNAGGPEGMRSPEFAEKLKKGPVFSMTLLPAKSFNMAPSLVQWFVFTLVVGVFTAYVAGRALDDGAHYLRVFRFAGVTAFTAYALAQWQESIWHKRSWSTTLKNNFDGLVYGLVTAGTFGWLWPN